MILNLWNEKRDMHLVQELPQEAKEVIIENLQTLENYYGAERTIEDLGGYVAVVDEDDIVSFKEEILKDTLPEYIDEIEGAEYISALFLLSSDFSVVLICEASLRTIIEG